MKGQGQKLACCFLAGDLMVAVLSWFAAYWLRFLVDLAPAPPDGIPPLDWCSRGVPLILLLTLASNHIAELYRLHRLRLVRQELLGILKANTIMFLLLVAITFYRRDPYKSRLAMGLFLSINVAGQLLARRIAWWLIHSLRGSGFNPSHAVIVGSGRMAQRLAQTLGRNAWTGLEPIGFVDDLPQRSLDPVCLRDQDTGDWTQHTNPTRQRGTAYDTTSLAHRVSVDRREVMVEGMPVLGCIERLAEIVEQEHAAYVFVALPLKRYDDMQRVLQQLADVPVDVRLVPDVPNLAGMSLSASELDGLPIVGLRGGPHQGMNLIIKRLMDIVVASLGLALLLPVFGVIAALIKLTSRGPVLYRQDRAGLGGEPFQMLKFRTMRADAEAETGPVWAIVADPRRTWIGRVLRATSLDELPQLINVLRGEMSLVGPRPERPVFINKFRRTVPHYMVRHSVKAGITGWAQVHGWRGNTSLRKRLQYDLHYIAHWTPWLDLRIMVLTLFRGMMSRNAY